MSANTSDGGSTSTGAITQDTTGDASSSSGEGTTGQPELVPTPCDDEVFDFAVVEPNNTPAQATDACTVPAAGYWGNFSGPGSLGGDDDVDYIVFKTPVAESITIPVIPCWQPGTDLLDLSIYEVVDGVPMETPVYESATPQTDCEGSFEVMLAPDTVFLLEMRLASDGAPATEYIW